MRILPDTEDIILIELETMFTTTNIIEEKRNIVDVVWRKQPDRGLILLNQLRQLDNQNRIIKNREVTVFTDTQNVHNSDINKSCLYVAINLIQEYWRPCDEEELINEVKRLSNLTLIQLEDIFNNVSTFSFSLNDITHFKIY